MYAYLKMEMPRTCYDCKLRRRNGLELICPVLERSYKIADTQVLFVREKDCPLIEVPESHGRLIEAEQLKETIDYYIREAGWNDEINKVLSWVYDFIDAQPTVIPAEEGGA